VLIGCRESGSAEISMISGGEKEIVPWEGSLFSCLAQEKSKNASPKRDRVCFILFFKIKSIEKEFF
jgi:hypothetical protein